VAERTDVVAEAPLIQTENAAHGRSDFPRAHSESSVERPEVSGPGYLDTGSTVSTDDQFGVVQANGTRSTTMSLTFGGVKATADRWAFVAIFPPLEAIQEFKVQTGNYKCRQVTTTPSTAETRARVVGQETPMPSSGDCEVAVERVLLETEAHQFDAETAAPVIMKDANRHRSQPLHPECERKQGDCGGGEYREEPESAPRWSAINRIGDTTKLTLDTESPSHGSRDRKGAVSVRTNSPQRRRLAHPNA
jgi:hypothetical protein